MKKVLLICIIAILTITSIGCGPVNELFRNKKFKKDGLTITLPKAFKENNDEEYSQYTVCYESNNILIVAIKEEFSKFEQLESMTLDEYTALVYRANSSKALTGIVKIEGLTTIEYEEDIDNDTYKYFTTTFKGKDAFWIVQFACQEDKYDTYKPDFIKWAKTVKV